MLAKNNIFRNPNLATRLLIWFGVVGLLPLTLVTFLSYSIASQSLTKEVTTSLNTITIDKAQQIEAYASERQKDVAVLAREPAVAIALEEYIQAVQSGGIDSPEYLTVEEEYRKFLTDFTQNYGYEDLFLISSAGNTVFSVKRGEDLGSNLYTGIFKGTELAKVFVDSQTLLSANFSDFAYYPATNEPAAFIAAPIMKDGNLIGAVALQINNTTLYDTVDNYSGLGVTGEIQIGSKVGDKILYVTPLRNDPYAAFRTSTIIGSNTGLAIQEAIQGLNGSAITTDYRGKEVVASWTYLPALRWGMVVKMDTSEALAPVIALRNAALGLGAASLLVVLFIAVLVSRTISRPIVNLTQIAQKISSGDINAQAKVETRDEIGTLASTFNQMTAQLRDFIGTLEQRVADRTKALATSTEVSRRLSTILDRNQLVREVVEQVKDAFNYYHAHIYLYDEDRDELVMAGGTGEAGKTMLAQRHKLPKGRGLVGRAAETNKPVLVPNTTKDPNWLPNELLPDTKSETAIPISVGDQVLGVLDVQHNIPDGLTQEDVDILQSLANQVAIALQNIAQYEHAQKVANDLGVVATVSNATSTITAIDRLLDEVVNLSKKAFNYYHAHIYLLDEAGDTLVLAAGAGDVGRHMVAEGRSIPLDSEKSLVARAARTQVGVVVNNVMNDPDFLPNPLLPQTRSEMAVPMVTGGKTIGVLDVQSETIGRFTEVDVNVKTTLASQIAAAVQNARSFTETQKRAERESTLNAIAQRIQSATTIETALQTAARELGHALGMKSTLVALDPSVLTGEVKAN